jgi:hypothetical protein
MTGLRSQRSMKRGSTPTPVCNELRLFSREAIALIEGVLSVIGMSRKYRPKVTAGQQKIDSGFEYKSVVEYRP